MAITLGPLAATSTGTLRAAGDPGDAARGRRVVQVQLRHRRRYGVRDVDVVEAHGLALEVGLELPQVALELRQSCRRAAEMGQGRIASADAQHGAAVRDTVDAGDGGRGRRGMARHRVGDAGAQTEPGRSCRRHRQRDIGIARQVLRIDHQHAVPAGGLDLVRRSRGASRRRDGRHPQLHVVSSRGPGGVPITSWRSGRSASVAGRRCRCRSAPRSGSGRRAGR